VLSGRCLCDELITRPEESYRLWCVVVCDLETSRICAPYIYDVSSLRVKIHRCVVNMVVVWLHILVGPCWCMYVALSAVVTQSTAETVENRIE